MTRRATVGRLLYGSLFVGVIPTGLALWARALDPGFPLPAIAAPLPGLACAAGGLSLLVAGLAQLMARGGGLPMNPFPPTRLVRSGPFRWIDNPIYLGFGLLLAGTSIATGSAAGLWLVTPVVSLAMAALVLGYERHDLRRRFGDAALEPPRFALPPADDRRPERHDRAAVYLRALVPWLVAYFAVQALGRPPDAFVTSLPLERTWPVVEWTELVYASVYIMVPLTPLLIATRRGLREFAIRGIMGTVIVTLLWLVIPVVADNREFVAQGPLGWLLAFEQANSRGVAAFPAFHVLWALIAAEGWRANSQASGRRIWGWIGYAWAAAIALSTITTAMHTMVEVLAALLLFVPLRRMDRSWEAIRAAAERVANSWREWRIGPVRVISHGAYAALAAGTGLLVAGSALGGETWHPIWVGSGILLGAGFLAQWLEGSSKLLRPFGWYGGVIGAVLGALAAMLHGAAIVPLLASFAVAAPWIQILGRFRCLVQGCCHGGPAPPDVGITYRHRRSRVTQLAGLAGVPVHATPLYSMAGNLVVGLLLVRLRILGTPDPIVLGSYLMLTGIARFVEESFRAEPQTPIRGGLRLYQWLGAASVVAGVLCTLLPGTTRPPGFTPPSLELILAAIVMALITGFIMGVDFPRSNRRFSRLAEAD